MADETDYSWDDNVVPFPRGQFERAQNERESVLDELPVRTDREGRPCRHERTSVNEGARVVKCRECDAVLDPIDVLAKLARSREALVLQGRSLRNEASHLQARVDDLKRQEKNTKARLRNAEHPALKEVRQALQEAEKVMWAAQHKLDFDPTLQRRVEKAWLRARLAAEALRPSNAAAS